VTRISNFKERYQTFQLFPFFAGEKNWADQLRTWQDFVEGGHLVADFFANIFRTYAREKDKEKNAPRYEWRFRQLCLALQDLLMEYFEEVLPWTDRRRK
jgi:hypothetical protein